MNAELKGKKKRVEYDEIEKTEEIVLTKTPSNL